METANQPRRPEAATRPTDGHVLCVGNERNEAPTLAEQRAPVPLKGGSIKGRFRASEGLTESAEHVIRKIQAADSTDADCQFLFAEILALIARLQKRQPRRAPEVLALLDGTVQIAVKSGDLAKARRLFYAALETYRSSTCSGNQLVLFFGAAAGAIGMLVMVACALALQQMTETSRYLTELAAPEVVAGVSFFAVAGSLTSLLVRLRNIDLSEEDDRLIVALTGVFQPTVAMGFATVVYAILAAQVVPLAATGPALRGIEYLAAFLCGFSEKFAPALLDRVGTRISGTSAKSYPNSQAGDGGPAHERTAAQPTPSDVPR
jgi:hypothetical protein